MSVASKLDRLLVEMESYVLPTEGTHAAIAAALREIMADLDVEAYVALQDSIVRERELREEVARLDAELQRTLSSCNLSSQIEAHVREWLSDNDAEPEDEVERELFNECYQVVVGHLDEVLRDTPERLRIEREFLVHFEARISGTVTVSARSEEDAEEEAINAVDAGDGDIDDTYDVEVSKVVKK